jgi:hypothetical protein
MNIPQWGFVATKSAYTVIVPTLRTRKMVTWLPREETSVDLNAFLKKGAKTWGKFLSMMDANLRIDQERLYFGAISLYFLLLLVRTKNFILLVLGAV